MDSSRVSIVVDLILLFYTAFIIINGFRMKKTGEPVTMLVSPEELKGGSNKKGFCEAMFTPMIVLGVVGVIYSLISLYDNLVKSMPLISGIAVFLFMGVAIWFFGQLRRNKTKYL